MLYPAEGPCEPSRVALSVLRMSGVLCRKMGKATEIQNSGAKTGLLKSCIYFFWVLRRGQSQSVRPRIRIQVV